MTAGEATRHDPSVPPPYITRFQRLRPALTIAVGGLALVMSSVWIARAVHGGRPAHVPPPLAVAVAMIAMVAFGVVRLVRGHLRGWIAFAVDADGIFFGAQSHGMARRFSWEEVNALVLFSRRTEFLQGSVECIGVRLHPTLADSPERYLARRKQLLAQPDLELHVWEQLRKLDNGPSESQLEAAVSFHAEARDWGFSKPRLCEAMRAHAPGVPVLSFTADSYYDLVGWRADQEKLREVLEEAE